MDKKTELKAPTELLRIVEGMMRYVDPYCTEESEKAVLCIAIDKTDKGRPTLFCKVGDSRIIEGALTSVMREDEEFLNIVTNSISRKLYQSELQGYENDLKEH